MVAFNRNLWPQSPESAEDIKMLMRDGGAGWKIPFNLVKEFRDFPG
jgi:hypothetical protein